MLTYQQDNSYAIAAPATQQAHYRTAKRWGLWCGVVMMALMLLSCANMSDTQQRTLSGAAIGTAGGAVVGAIAGDAGLGMAVGAAAGAAGGYLYDRHEKSKQDAYEQGRRDAEAQSR